MTFSLGNNVYFFHRTFFSTPLGSIFKLNLTRLPKLVKNISKHDNLNCRARKDPLVEGMSLLVGMTSIPILGASPASVLSDLELFYIDFNKTLHDFNKILTRLYIDFNKILTRHVNSKKNFNIKFF